MRNTPTGFITIPSLLGSPAALRSPNRRAPSPTKVPAQWASGRCKKLGCATGAVSPGGPGIGTSRSFIYIYVFIYIYIATPKRLEGKILTMFMGFDDLMCLSFLIYTHASISYQKLLQALPLFLHHDEDLWQLRAPGSDKYRKRWRHLGIFHS